MTNKEAITVLNMIEAHGSLAIQAKEKAIQALQATDGDLISIKKVHSVLHNHMFDNAHRPKIYTELKRISKELDGLI